MMLFYDISPTSNIIWIPFLILLALITALGLGLWFAALNVQFRDIRYTIPFIIQLWLFATPVAYPSSLLSESWRALYGLNPMVGVIEGFRWALLGSQTAPGQTLLVSSMTAAMLFISGLLYFRRLEQTFADFI